MKIGIGSTGRSLDENVFEKFGKSPAFLIYDTDNKSIRAIDNFAKYSEGCNKQAIQILIDNDVSGIISGNMDDNSIDILKNRGVDLYKGYPGTGKEALEKLLKNNLDKFFDSKDINKTKKNEGIKLLELEQTFNKEFVPYVDWCMILNLLVAEDVPKNWLYPKNFADGVYHLKLEVTDMKITKKPIEFEFGWCNFQEEKHPNIPHRCSFGIYSSFTCSGIYEHIARIKDMENTSVDGKEEEWDWTMWESPFTLIKPYLQDPYPVTIKFSVMIYSN